MLVNIKLTWCLISHLKDALLDNIMSGACLSIDIITSLSPLIHASTNDGSLEQAIFEKRFILFFQLIGPSDHICCEAANCKFVKVF